MRYLVINNTYETIKNTYKADILKIYNERIEEVLNDMDTENNFCVMLEDSYIVKGEENFRYYLDWYKAEGYKTI